jgi:hypothetical protein
MHPVLAQETIHDLTTRHTQRIDAELRHIDAMTEGAGLPVTHPARQPLGMVARAAIATFTGLPKRWA